MPEVVFSDSAAGSLQNCPQFVESGDVLPLPFSLSFGDISEPVPGPKRLAARPRRRHDCPAGAGDDRPGRASSHRHRYHS